MTRIDPHDWWTYVTRPWSPGFRGFYIVRLENLKPLRNLRSIVTSGNLSHTRVISNEIRSARGTM